MSKHASDRQLPAYALAGVALWYCLLRGGINADIAGVATAMALPAPAPGASGNAEETLLDKLHHALAPWTAFLIMPVFALANTAVPFASTSVGALMSAPVAQGIALGLILGKPLGIVAFSMLGIRLGWATWPTGMMLKHLLVVGVLGGIGFTMSLFLIGCSFSSLPALAASAKLAVLSGSIIAAVLGSAMLATFPAPQRAPAMA
jgi:NhaA family Na+:H+ antiporter